MRRRVRMRPAPRGAEVLAPTGALCEGAVERLEAALACTCAPVVVIDLREVVVIDVAGARLLAGAGPRLGACGRRLIVVSGDSGVERFLSTVGLDARLEFV